MLPLLVGEEPGPAARQQVVHHSGDGTFSLRRGEWKLILGTGSGGFSEPVGEKVAPGEPGGQLYNLAEDPGERRNLWDQRQAVVDELTARLMACRDAGRAPDG
jgi:hypothetical protein